MLRNLSLIAWAVIVCALLAALPARADVMLPGTSCSGSQNFNGNNGILTCNGSSYAANPTFIGTASSAPYTCSGTTYLGMIYYDTTAGALKNCTASGWAAVGSGGTNNTLVSGWPDAIECNITSPTMGLSILTPFLMPYSGNSIYYYGVNQVNGGGFLELAFNSSGTYNSGYSTTAGTSVTSNCNVSISTLYANGQAFNFAKGPSAQWLQNGTSAYYNAGNVSIGTTSVGSLFNVNGGVSIGTGYVGTPAPTNGAIIQGNVGIGTTNPTTTLQVRGGTNANLRVFAGSLFGTGYSGIGLQASADDNSTANMLVMGGSPTVFTGNVGIGSASPSFPLSVSGGVANNTCYSYLVFGAASSAGVCQNDGTVSGSNGSGVVAIYTPTTILAGEFDAYSDYRKKTDISLITAQEGIDFVTHVEPVHFHWKTDGVTAERSHGYIAQQLIVGGYKSLVHLSKDDTMKAEKVPTDGGYVNSPAGSAFEANYIGAIPYLHAGLKALVHEVQELKSDNDNLRAANDTEAAQIKALTARLDALEAVPH